MPFIKDIPIRSKKGTPSLPDSLYAWGNNGSGQLGDGTTTNRSSPVLITDGVSVASAARGAFSHFIKSGELWGSGTNTGYELGDGTNVSKQSFVQIGSATDWYNIDGGTAHCLAIKNFTSGGELYAWGTNFYGEAGSGGIFIFSPVQIGADADWYQISAGNYFSLGIRYAGSNFEIGSLWSFGGNGTGELGLGDTTNRSSPVQVGALETWFLIAAGAGHSLGITYDPFGFGDYSLFSWGWNSNGQLGDGTTTNRSSPVLITNTFSRLISVSAGGAHSAYIVEDGFGGGSLWTFGQNTSGQLGDGTTTNRSSPVQVGAGTDWVHVSCGTASTYALKSDGTLWAWGSNIQGRLGDGTTTNRSSPVQIGTLTTWNLLQDVFLPSTLSAGGTHAMAVLD